ncbi:DNA (cytosine-5-)-methyltransferase [Actibacterium sp. MT2.3-13A]|uniref:DNA (cytosine-5-)-methyltransferase n=1 Tax=Actibacterium sp. MT2.3-13A TaxID=2828332 RepID=UPI00201269EB|nr:DNA (cytosine-5-)-methyltransferase [Actibacterium sp. MT2.3-13A]
MTVCSGIGAPEVAAPWIDWKYQSEIEPFPCAVLAERFPDAVNLGDMTKFEEWPDATVDVLCGGTPCQSFSVAGLRKGLDDPRGNLMLTYLAIARRYRPRWLVWENVPGVLSSNGGRDFGTFLGALGELGYGFAYRVLDAQHCRTRSFPQAVPQRRRRVFVVGYLGDWRRAAAVLFDAESMRGDTAPRREAGKRTPAAAEDGAGKRCSVDGCDRDARKRGWCNAHYQHWRKHGEPGSGPVNAPGETDHERFWSKVEKTESCWDWTAALNEKGYGIFWSNDQDRSVRAHRFAYEQIDGEIPDGLELDHLCRNRKCVNPAHLEPVTGKENTRRGNAGKHWAVKRGETVAETAPTISARPTGGGGLGTDFDCDGGLITSHDPTCTLTARERKGALPEADLSTIVAHSLRGEGFDASEDGTGRGTPLVPVHSRTPDIKCGNCGEVFVDEYGDGIGGLSPFECPMCGEENDLYVVPLAFGAQNSAAQGDQISVNYSPPITTTKTPAVAFDTTQITSPGNYSNPRPGDSCHPLAASADAPAIATPWDVRRLTPTECERLQGFPDGWTRIAWRGKPPEKCPDGPRYKALGNSWAVNCGEFVFDRIRAVEEMT